MLSLATIALVFGLYFAIFGGNTVDQNDPNQQVAVAAQIDEEKNQRIEGALNNSSPPEGWTELDCSIKDVSFSPGATSITTVLYSPENDPATDCNDATNAFYVSFGLEMPDNECNERQQIVDINFPNPNTDKSGCDVVQLGPRTYTREFFIEAYSMVEYVEQGERLLHIRYFSGEDGSLPYFEEVEQYISNIKI